MVQGLLERELKYNNDDIFMEMFHRLVLSLLLSTDTNDIQAVPLFIDYSFVGNDDERSGMYHYGNGNDISHVTAALLHFCQCIFVQEMYGNNRPPFYGEII